MSDPYNWFFAQDTDNVWATAGNTIYNTNKGFVGVGTKFVMTSGNIYILC